MFCVLRCDNKLRDNYLFQLSVIIKNLFYFQSLKRYLMKSILQNFVFGVLLLSTLVLLMSIIGEKGTTSKGPESNLKTNANSVTDVSFWLTKGDESVLL